MSNYYEILGLDSNVSIDVIEAKLDEQYANGVHWSRTMIQRLQARQVKPFKPLSKPEMC